MGGAQASGSIRAGTARIERITGGRTVGAAEGANLVGDGAGDVRVDTGDVGDTGGDVAVGEVERIPGEEGDGGAWPLSELSRVSPAQPTEIMTRPTKQPVR